MPENTETEKTDNIDRETLRFLYDKRMALFNFRRDHEWRIIFGVLILLGAVDAALVSKPICLSPDQTLMWQIGIVTIGIATVMYEFGIQARNRVDRRVMDRLQVMLCEAGGIRDKKVRICIDIGSDNCKFEPKFFLHWTYFWAFTSQCLVLIVACIVSCLVPRIACEL